MARKKETTKERVKETKVEENQVFISEADQYVFGQGTHYDIRCTPFRGEWRERYVLRGVGSSCSQCACDRYL